MHERSRHGDAKSKTYGDAIRADVPDHVGTLAFGDSVRGGLTRAAGENIGSYAIGQGTLALNSNYSVSFIGAT
jgi:hypothetical protein